MSKLIFYILGCGAVAIAAGFGFTLGEDIYYALTGLVGICRG